MTTTYLFKNDAVSTLAGPISAVATSISVASGAGVLFPSPAGGGQVFALTIVSASNPTLFEIVYCTAVSGDTLTVVRGQEGTTAKAFFAGDIADHRLTAGSLNNFLQSAVPGVTSVPITYYVNASTGNNSNSGLLPGQAFADIQTAINVASTIRTINTQISISVANGTYSNWNFSNVVGCSIKLIGNEGSPSSCIINTNGSGTYACDISNYAMIEIRGFQFNGIGGGIRARILSAVSVANCIFNTSGQQTNSAYGIYSLGSSVITATGPLTVSNGSAAFLVAGQRSTVAVDNQTITVNAASFTMIPGVAIGFFAWANGGAITATNVTFAGSGVTYGQRLEVDAGGAVYTGVGASGALTYFPGTTSGIVATGCYAG